jgi:poly(3-hydroxybutyrate) depolymerase
MSRRRSVPVVLALGALLVLGTTLSGGLSGTSTRAYAATTAGCGKAPTLTNGTKTIQSSGQNRTYILDIPTNYDPNHAYRLIFGLHWLNGTATDVATGGSDGAVFAFYGQKQLSNNSTIFVAPQGLNNGWSNTNGQDVTLIDNILNVVQTGLCVDTTQTFAMGWSFGGAMSFALACARPTVFRAVVVYSGANLSGCSGGTQPVAYFGIHGIHDSVLNISNGRSLRDTFVRNNGCTAQTPREPTQGSLTHITTTYSGCRAGFPVQWAAFDGDHTPSPVDGSTTTSGARTWTSGEANRFLAQFQTPTNTTPPPSTTPPSTTTPPPTTTTSPPPTPSGGCSATYTRINEWAGGFQGEVRVTNTGTTATSSWGVTLTFANGQRITQIWNARTSSTVSPYAITNEVYNGGIPVSGSTTFGFLGSWTGTNTNPSATCTRSP